MSHNLGQQLGSLVYLELKKYCIYVCILQGVIHKPRGQDEVVGWLGGWFSILCRYLSSLLHVHVNKILEKLNDIGGGSIQRRGGDTTLRMARNS